MHSLKRLFSYLLVLLISVTLARCELWPESCSKFGLSVSDEKQMKCVNKFYKKYHACSTSQYTRDLVEYALFEACCHTVCQKYVNGKVDAVKCKREVGYYIQKTRPDTTDGEKLICSVN